MISKSVFVAVIAASTSVAAQASPAASMVSTVTNLTRVADFVTRDIVYVNNPPDTRSATIGIIDAVGLRANTDLAEMNSTSKRAALTTDQQADLASQYQTFVEVTNSFLGACVDKHLAVIQHNAAHSMASSMNHTFAILDKWSDTMMTLAPAQKANMTSQKSLFDQAYTMATNLYLKGPNGPGA